MKALWTLPWLVVLSGCRAPEATMDPFVGYGARVIPPPATGSVGTAPGYFPPTASLPNAAGAAPAMAPATSFVPPQGLTPPTANPGTPSPVPLQAVPPNNGTLLLPPQASQWQPDGNWQTASASPPASYGSPPPLAGTVNPATSPYSLTYEGSNNTGGLEWRSPSAMNPAIQPASVEFAPAQLPPQLNPTDMAGGLPATSFIPPVRPSVVRPASYGVESYLAPASWSEPCCDPVGGPVAPIPMDGYAVPSLGTTPIAPAAPSATVVPNDRWQRRR